LLVPLSFHSANGSFDETSVVCSPTSIDTSMTVPVDHCETNDENLHNKKVNSFTDGQENGRSPENGNYQNIKNILLIILYRRITINYK
jgi:hypothetical protein